MRKYRTGLAVLMAVSIVGIIFGCGNKKQEIPITTVSQSTEDEDPEDTMNGNLPGEGIPVYDVELPEELSSFDFAVWGVNYQIPMTYGEFVECGWTYDGDDQEMVSGQSYLQGETFAMEDSSVTVDIMNPEASEQPVSQCYIAGFHVDAETREGQGVYVNLPGNIVLQNSVEDDVIAAYGAPKDRYEQEQQLVLTYEFGLNRTVQLGFDRETGLLMQLNLQNLKNPAGDEMLEHAVSQKTPEVEAYQAPETLGTDLSEFVVSYDGVLYRLPVPVSVLTEHGWEINKKESDEAVKGFQYGYVTLEKDGRRVFGNVRNDSEAAVKIKNCFVTTLYGDMDTTKVPITVAGNITLGTPEEEFLAADLGEYKKMEDTEKQTATYTFYAGGSEENYTEITVDMALHLVRSIRVVNQAGE